MSAAGRVPAWLWVVLGLLPVSCLVLGIVIGRDSVERGGEVATELASVHAGPEFELEITDENIPNRAGWHEADWRDAWVRRHGGEPEVILADGTRADIVTDGYAIEVDWGHKWTEGVGQALWYSMQTNKPAGLVLVVASEADERAILRATSTIQLHELPVRVWVVR